MTLLDSVEASLEGQIETTIRGVIGVAFDALPSSAGFDSALDEAADFVATVTGLPATFSSVVTVALDDALDGLLAPLSEDIEQTAHAVIDGALAIYVTRRSDPTSGACSTSSASSISWAR